MLEVRVRRALVGACCALLIGLGSSACSKLDSSSTTPPASTSPSALAVPLVVRLGTITGRLPAPARSRLRSDVGGVIDGWWQAAYLSTGNPDPFTASFTAGAAKLAQRDADLLSNAGMAQKITGTDVRRREADLDVLAVKGAARGVTAVLHLTYDTTGDLTQRCGVGGTVSLIPVSGSWRIFGYDVTHHCHARKAGS